MFCSILNIPGISSSNESSIHPSFQETLNLCSGPRIVLWNITFSDISLLSQFFSGVFPVAAVGDHHYLDGLKQQKFILSLFWRPEVWSQYHQVEMKVSAGL